MERKSASALVCPECGGDFSAADLLDGDSIVTCLNCGRRFSTSEILKKSSEVEAEEIRSSAYRDVESERTKAYREVEAEKTRAYRDVESEKARIYRESEEARRKFETESIKREQRQRIQVELDYEGEKFKKGKASKLLLILSVVATIMAIIGFATSSIVSGVIATIMAIATIIGWLIGINAISASSKGMQKTVVTVSFLLCLPLIVLYFTQFSDLQANKTYEWSNVVLSEFLPQPETNNGEIADNSDKELTLKLYNVSEADYVKYKNSCIEFGYTERSKNETNSYFAVNSLGYRLDITYYSYSEEIRIELEIPDPASMLNWNEFVMGNIVPTPDTLEGRVVVDSDKELHVYLAEATKSTLSSYTQKCKDAGFTIDSVQSTNSFEAYNAEGYQVKLFFHENDAELSITLYDPIKRNTLNWATVSLMKPLPTPPSNVGEFANNYDWTVTVYILDVTREDYENYVDQCIEKGFTIDQSRYENSFYGDNKDGYEIQVSWKGNNTMYISVTNYKYF